jgi:hypothetical protein
MFCVPSGPLVSCLILEESPHQNGGREANLFGSCLVLESACKSISRDCIGRFLDPGVEWQGRSRQVGLLCSGEGVGGGLSPEMAASLESHEVWSQLCPSAHQLSILLVFRFLRQSLTIYPRLASNTILLLQPPKC